MSNDNRYWALILHLRPHQITQRHRPVVFAEDYDALAAERDALRKDAERWRHEWQRECADTDLLLQGMGLCPSEYRSEGGSLLLGRISHKLKQRGGLS